MNRSILIVVPTESRRNSLLAGLLLVLLTLAAYWPAIHAGFIWDDDQYVTHQRHQRTLGDLQRIWTDPQFSPQYYPLIHTSFWVEYHLWKFEPMGYHAVNVAMHAATACLIALAFLRLGWACWPAWLVGAMFALHPLNVESVAWVTERKNVMCVFFYVFTFHALISLYRLDGKGGAGDERAKPQAAEERFRWGIYALTIVLFAATLTSKTVGSVLPAVMVLVLWWKGRRLDAKTLTPLAPLLVMGALMGRVTSWLETTHVGANGQDWDISLLDRTLIAGRVVWFYFGKWFWPDPLVFIYPRWTVEHTQWWRYLFPLGAAGVVAALWALRGKIGRGPLAATLIYLGCLLPASGFFNIYPQRFSFVADHFAYLATIALAVLVVGVVWEWAGKSANQHGRWAVALLVIAIGASAVVTNLRTQDYKSGDTLWEDTYRKDPDGMLTLICVSGIRGAHGDPDAALALLKTAVEKSHGHPMALTTLATHYEEHGERDKAIETYRAAVAAFRGIEPERGVAHQALGRLLTEAGDKKAAAEQLVLALKCRPKDMDSALHLAELLQSDAQWARAASLYEQVVAARPHEVSAWLNLGMCNHQLGRLKEAVECFERVLGLAPDHSRAHNNLGVVLTIMGKPDRAIPHFEAALRASPDDLAAMRNLAVALGAVGQTIQAAALCDKAAQAAAQQGNAAMAEDFAERAKRFRAGG